MQDDTHTDANETSPWGFCDCVPGEVDAFLDTCKTLPLDQIEAKIVELQEGQAPDELTHALTALVLWRLERRSEVPDEYASQAADRIIQAAAYLVQSKTRTAPHDPNRYDTIYSYCYNLMGIKDVKEGLPYLLMQELDDTEIMEHGVSIRCGWLVNAPTFVTPDSQQVQQVERDVTAYYNYPAASVPRRGSTL